MGSSLFCVACAVGEELVAARFLHDGRTACTGHTGSAEAAPMPAPSAVDAASLRCAGCDRAPHRAYFVVDDQPLCTRHAADAVFPDDDMRAHDLAHAAYLHLNAAGVDDAY